MEINAAMRLMAATLEEQAATLQRITNTASYDHARKQAIERVKNGQGTPADAKLIVEQLKRWATLGTGLAKSEAQKALAGLQVTAIEHTQLQKLKEIERSFEAQLKKSGVHGVEVTIIGNGELNIASEDRRAFEKAKEILTKVRGLKFKNEDKFEEDGMVDYMAWYTF